MSSTRLPGKVLMDICGQTMLARVARRVQRANTLDAVIVATTIESQDDAIVEEAVRLGVSVFRGSEEDVLDRYYQAATTYALDAVVRITSDCPLIDAELIDEVIQHFLQAQPRCDYAANTLERTYPRGLDVEVVWLDTLACAWREAKEPYQRVHVTAFIREHPERFRLLSVVGGGQCGELRWTVDTADDLYFVREVYSRLNNAEYPGWREVLAVLEANPGLMKINAHVRQKGPKEI